MRTLEQLERDTDAHQLLVFDALRNLGEIETLRDQFGRRFYLIGLECQKSDRWERIRATEYDSHGLTIDDFVADDDRDRDQEYGYGQQVQLCVDQADALIVNDDAVTQAQLRAKVLDYVSLLTGEKPRFANATEILMNLAYSSAHGSKCLKRQVGAVLVSAPPYAMGEIVGQGFNENPMGTRPCVEEKEYGADIAKGTLGRCFRDIVRQTSFEEYVAKGVRCPSCGKALTAPISPVPPWKCNSCRSLLEDFLWPERAMSLCTAVHAEVTAILGAGDRSRGCTLYTTTFPCFQCAEKIAHVGIKSVIYTEPYPDVRAAARLEIANVTASRFEGVRSGRFDEIFARARPYVSDQIELLAKRSGA